MEKKKTNKANLEKMKALFFIISLGIAFAIINYAFSIRSKSSTFATTVSEPFVDGQTIPITRPPDKKPEPIKPEFKTFITDIINIVPEDEEIDTTEYYIPEFNDDPSLYDIPEEESEETIYNPTVKPKFPGGISALKQFIANNTVYPIPAKENNIQGTVVIRFEVTKKGTIGKISVINKTVDEILQNEAVRVVKTLPKFKPGIQNGKPVNVWYSLPVSFKLK